MFCRSPHRSRSPRQHWLPPLYSTRFARDRSASWIGGSTAPDTTPRRLSRHSPPGYATRLISRRYVSTCSPSSVTPSSPPTPRSGSALLAPRAQALLDRSHRREDRSWLVAAVRHAVVAPLVPAATVLAPVGGLDEFLVRLHVAIGHQVARALPAQQRVRGNPPCGALEIDLALEEVEE